VTKVCMVSIKHSSFDDRLYYKESRSLLKNGYEVHIISALSSITEKDNVQASDYFNLKREYVSEITKNTIFNRILALPLLFIKSLQAKADVYHCHEPETFFVILLIKLITGKKIIYDVYESYPDVVSMSNGFYKLILMTILHLEPLLCRFADGIITADSDIAKRYEKFNRPICTLYNYPCMDLFNESIPEDKLDSTENVLIYVGGLSEERGILDLLKTINLIYKKDIPIKLLLVGRFSNRNFEKKCIEYVKSNGISDVVSFVGLISHTRIAEYIYCSDFGVVLLHLIPKFHKNIPTKQFEYMACGKPVIGSDLPPISKYINDAQCGILVNPNNTTQISDAIIFLIEHPEEAKKMGMNGMKAVHDKYNWEKQGHKLILFYHSILN